MEWWLSLILIFGALLVILTTGMPIAIAFLVVNVIGIFIWWGGLAGLSQLINSTVTSLNNFALIPIPLFLLMGEVMFRTTIVQNMINSLDKWLGRLPGRLSLLAVAAGVLIATTSGSSIAATAMLGQALVPEMDKRGYKREMSLGPIMGSGGLAVLIPPSAMAIIIGAIAQGSIAAILIGIIMPGLLLATVMSIYIITRCKMNPSLAPPYEVASVPFSEKVTDTAKYILPLAIIIFLVTGVIILGIASPSEAAATGALGTFIMAAAYRRLNWNVVKESVLAATEFTIMVFFILMTSTTFAQVLAFSGGTQGMIKFALQLALPPIGIVILMQIILLILGMFINPIAMMMITLPIFIPIIHSFGFDTTWFLVLFLLNTELGGLSPPFGMVLFTMQGVVRDSTFMDCVRAAIPFIGCQTLTLALVVAFPAIALWLPGLMGPHG